MDFLSLLSRFNQFFTLYLVFPAIVFLGLYLSVRLRLIQFGKLSLGFATLFKRGQGEGNISHYQAVAAVLASNFGTGNISGMAVALATGGPGALVWMWVMTFLGSVLQFVSCFLGAKYRKKNERGEYVGGPMYYLKEGLGWRRISALFSLVVIGSAFAAGFVQVNSVALPLAQMGVPPWLCGSFLAFFVAIAILGGAVRIAKVSSAVVPIMAFLYLGSAAGILVLHADQLPPLLALIGKAAFGKGAYVGGAAGFAVMRALTVGFDRAIFAADIGTGSVTILQSEARSEHPAITGVVTLVAPFLVMLVCSATMLVLLVTGAYAVPELQSTNMVTYAFEKGLGGTYGSMIVLIALILFGYTTILAWASCLARASAFLFKPNTVRLLQLLFICLIPLGAMLKVHMVWTLADIALTLMLIFNLAGVAALSKEVIGETRAFFLPKKAAAK